MIKNIRGSFEFSFTPSFNYIDFGTIILDLAYLASVNKGNQNNLRCMFLKNSEISHEFGDFN